MEVSQKVGRRIVVADHVVDRDCHALQAEAYRWLQHSENAPCDSVQTEREHAAVPAAMQEAKR